MAYTTIDDPSAYFQTLVFAGTGGDASVTQPTTHTNTGNSDLQPDFIWFKEMGASYEHYLVDSSRGRAKGLHTDEQSAETTTGAAGNDLVSFDSDGFKVGAPSEGNSTNGGTTNKVAWQWKANGGTTTSVSASGTGSGCVNACTHQANTTAGFSIITYTGRDDQLSNGQESKLTHGLGVAPSVFICKRRDGNSNWYYLGGKMVTTNNGWNNVHLLLNQTAAADSNSYTSNTEPDSTYIYLGNQLVNTVDSWVGYAFAEKQGYSKFGSYKGNSNDNGTFVYTGFKPRWIMFKSTQAGMSWDIIDTARSTSNVMNDYLTANTSDPQGTSTTKNIDFLSNGFKCRDDNNLNFSDHTYIYMAFAENPFVTSTGIPTTAR